MSPFSRLRFFACTWGLPKPKKLKDFQQDCGAADLLMPISDRPLLLSTVSDAQGLQSTMSRSEQQQNLTLSFVFVKSPTTSDTKDFRFFSNLSSTYKLFVIRTPKPLTILFFLTAGLFYNIKCKFFPSIVINQSCLVALPLSIRYKPWLWKVHVKS